MIEANTPEEFESGFHSENPSNVFRPYYALGITGYFGLNLSLRKTQIGKPNDNLDYSGTPL